MLHVHLISVVILVLTGFYVVFYTKKPVVAAIIGLAALVIVLKPLPLPLPFFGETLVPCSLLTERVPDHADTDVNVSGLEPGAKVLYWAAEPATAGLAKINDWRRAYLDFANAGVTVVPASGHAVLRIRKPQPYTVPIKGRIESHVHWRVCKSGGFLGPVQTTMIAH